MRHETWPTVESRTVRFSSLVITTFRAQWNAALMRKWKNEGDVDGESSKLTEQEMWQEQEKVSQR